MKSIVKFADLKAAFLAQNPNSIIEQKSGAVQVQYTKCGYYYTYRGTLAQIADKLHLNCNEITLQDRGSHDLDGLDLADRKIKIDIFGELTECLISRGYVNFWFRYGCNMGERHKLKIYRYSQGYYFNLDSQRINFVVNDAE